LRREPRIGQVSLIESREVLGDLFVRNVLTEECRDVFQRDSRAPEDRFPTENVRRRSDALLAPAIRGNVSLDGFAEMLALNEYLHVPRAKHDVRPVRNPMPRGFASVGELSFAKIRSACRMNNIQRGHVTCYSVDV
jgi:hypothetical protein